MGKKMLTRFLNELETAIDNEYSVVFCISAAGLKEQENSTLQQKVWHSLTNELYLEFGSEKEHKISIAVKGIELFETEDEEELWIIKLENGKAEISITKENK